jgi:hypothetical protein
VEALALGIGVRDKDHLAEANAAAKWVEGEFRRIGGGEVTVQAYDVKGARHFNVCLEIRGSAGGATGKEIVVVGAHYDTALGTPGADDNGSGVAGLLELARRFSAKPVSRTIRLVSFGTEEPPYIRTNHMGSWHYARMCRERSDNIVGMLSLEVIGYFSDEPGSQRSPEFLTGAYPTVGNFLVWVGDTSVGPRVRRAREVFAEASGVGGEVMILPRYVRGVNSSDQWSFWQFGYPGMMVCGTGPWRNKNYHQPGDLPQTLDFERMAKSVVGIEAVIRQWTEGEKEGSKEGQ